MAAHREETVTETHSWKEIKIKTEQQTEKETESANMQVKESKRSVSSVSLSPSYTGSKVLTGHSCTHLGSWRKLLQLPWFPRHISPSHGCRTSAPGFGLNPRESAKGLETSHLIKKSENEVKSGRFKHCCRRSV